MLPEVHLYSKHLSNSSATSGHFLTIYDFYACKGFEQGTYLWATCSALCFAFGFPASIAILWEMFKTHRRGSPFTPNDLFILNVSAMDAVFLFFIPPGIFNNFIWKNMVFESIWNSLYALNTCGRPLLMSCVCLDCYLAVVHPITYRKRKSLTPRVIMAAIVWTLTVADGIAYFMSYRLYLTMFSNVPFIIAMVIIGVCDSFIVYTLIKSDPSRKNIHPQKQRAIQTLINSLIMAVVSYLPPVLLYSIGLPLISANTFMCTIGIPVTITSTLGSAVMPLLYLNNLGKLYCFRLGCCRKS